MSRLAASHRLRVRAGQGDVGRLRQPPAAGERQLTVPSELIQFGDGQRLREGHEHTLIRFSCVRARERQRHVHWFRQRIIGAAHDYSVGVGFDLRL